MKLDSLLKQIAFAVVAVGILSSQATAQSDAGWEVIHEWGQLPEGLEWAATSAIDTTPEGNIAVLPCQGYCVLAGNIY